MSVDAHPESRSMIMRLVLTIVGVLLMLGPPYAFPILKLTSRLQNTVIAGIELSSLAVGFVLLYLGLKEQESPTHES